MPEKEVRLIDANELKLIYEEWIAKTEACPIDECAEVCQAIYDCLWELNNAPTIDPESLRPKGKWMRDGNFLICLNCESEIDVKNSLGVENKKDYCPNCGARMEE